MRVRLRSRRLHEFMHDVGMSDAAFLVGIHGLDGGWYWDTAR